jgi:hypothetical protein
MNMTREVQCPYCQTKQQVIFEDVVLYGANHMTVTCDCDEGGCDEVFVAALRVRAEVSVYHVAPAGAVNEMPPLEDEGVLQIHMPRFAPGMSGAHQPDPECGNCGCKLSEHEGGTDHHAHAVWGACTKCSCTQFVSGL